MPSLGSQPHLTIAQVEAYDELLGITPISDEDPLAQRARRTLDSLRKDWIVTPFLPHTLIYNRGIYFGTIILLRKSFVERLGASISLSAVPLPSQCDRCLHLASLTRDGKALLRIGTTHLDGAPIAVALRKAQLEHCAQHLIINDAPSILTGDFNNVTLDELDAIIAPPYSYTDSMRNFDTRPTYNTTYWLKGSNTQRIDFVLLSKEWEVEEGKVLGEEAVKLPKGMERPKRVAPDGKVYPSDHVGVWVRARLS